MLPSLYTGFSLVPWIRHLIGGSMRSQYLKSLRRAVVWLLLDRILIFFSGLVSDYFLLKYIEWMASSDWSVRKSNLIGCETLYFWNRCNYHLAMNWLCSLQTAGTPAHLYCLAIYYKKYLPTGSPPEVTTKTEIKIPISILPAHFRWLNFLKKWPKFL